MSVESEPHGSEAMEQERDWTFDPEVPPAEELRQMVWQMLIVRDRVLKLVDCLPEPDAEKVREATGRVATLCADLREIADSLPMEKEDYSDLWIVDDPDDIRSRMQRALEELEDVMSDLREVAGPDEHDETEKARLLPN
jgi:hypothetical protein